MSSTAAFWDRIAEKYAAKRVSDEASYQRKLALTREYLQPDMEVMELGCGTGTTALYHAPYVKSILATDISTEMLSIAREKARKGGVSNVIFERGEASKFTSGKDTFDVIMAHSLLHLLDDDGATIKAAYNCLKPGGLFITSTVCLDGFYRAMQIVWPLLVAVRAVPKLRFFSPDKLVQEHIRAGFVLEHQWQPKRPTMFLIARKPNE